MSSTLELGFILQALSVVILIVAFGRQTFRRVGPYFVFGAFLYHGVTEIVQRAQGIPSTYRGFANTHYIDEWAVLAGGAMMLFSLAYVVVSRVAHKSPSPGLVISAAEVHRVVSVLNWRLLAMLCVPLVAVAGTSAFRNGDQTGLVPAPTSVLAGLALQFLLIALTLTTISYVADHSGRFLLPVLIQVGLTSLVGSRLAVIVGAGTTIFGLAALGRSPSRRQILISLAVVTALSLTISAGRSHVGRDQLRAAGLVQRVNLMVSSAVATVKGEPVTYSGQRQSLGERLDGNSFPAAVLSAQLHGRATVGLATVKNDLLLSVPSFVNPAKLSSNLESRSEKAYINDWYSILIKRDFLPTQLGTMLAYYGPVGLLFLASLLGAAVGYAERLFRRKLTPSRFILTLALFTCVTGTEGSMDLYPLEFRGALALILVVFLADHLRQLRAGQRQQLPVQFGASSSS